MEFITLIFIITTLILFYKYLRHAHNFYNGTDVKYIEPLLPFFAFNTEVFCKMELLNDYINNVYKTFPKERYIGLFESTRPIIMLRDVELIKQIGIKEFDTFHDHRALVDDRADPAFGKILFSLKGNPWRDMRATLSPAFTSSKMRNMFVHMEECAKDMANFFLDECKNSPNQSIEIDVRDAFLRYTVDVIANTAYGMKINSLKDRNNSFYIMSNNLLKPSIFQSIKLILFNMYPKISDFIDCVITDKRVIEFFSNFTREVMRNRKESNIIRHDMINLLMQAQMGTLKYEMESNEQSATGFSTVEESTIGKQTVKTKWTDDEIVGQTYVFFLGSVDTTSSALTFFFYEVCRQPEIIKKLQKEIDDFKSESGDKLTYNDIAKLKYLDMCVSETLRHWPPAPYLDRVCSKPFTLSPPNESSMKTYEIKKDHAVLIPVYGIHHDEKYYKNPSEFDPERFSDENKHLINPTAFIPFGIGPRNCIGSRYALITMKAIIFHMMANFDITLSSKTDNPIIIDYNPVSLKPKNGVWIKMKPKNC